MIPGLSLLLVLAPYAPGDGPECRVPRLPAEVAPPLIDGSPGDPAWDHAAVLGELRQVEPVAGGYASEQTEIRLLYDDQALYLRFLCRDSDPSGIRDTQRLRDAELQASYRSASTLGFDEMIDPRETRNSLLEGLERALYQRQAPPEPVAHIGIAP